MLLPQSDETEDFEEDPRENLVGRLIEYQNYKEYTETLNEKKEERAHYFSKHPTDLSHLEQNETWDPDNTIDLTELIIAYQRVKNRMELNTPKAVNIHKETFTIQQATSQVQQRLQQEASKMPLCINAIIYAPYNINIFKTFLLFYIDNTRFRHF